MSRLKSLAVGIPAPILKLALRRQAWGGKPVTPEVVAEQRKIADRLFKLGLILKPIRVHDAVLGNGT